MLFQSLASLVVLSDAARVEQHLNIEEAGDKGGLIKVLDGSKCLAVYGKNIHASGEVTIFAETCKNHAKHQTWKHENGALKPVSAPGKCLDIFEDKCENGQNLILWPCNGQKNQQFQFHDSTTSLRSSKCNNKCIDVDMASSIKNVLLWDCDKNGKQNQKMDWAAEWHSLAQQAEMTVGVWEGTIKGYKGYCIDVYSPNGKSEGTNTAGTNIVSWPCHGGSNQQWSYKDGQIKNVKSKMCLDIDQNTCARDQNLILWDCNGQDNQLWSVSDSGQIKSKKCNMCVDIDLASNTKDKNLYNVLMWDCKTTADKVNQQWTVGGR